MEERMYVITNWLDNFKENKLNKTIIFTESEVLDNFKYFGADTYNNLVFLMKKHVDEGSKKIRVFDIDKWTVIDARNFIKYRKSSLVMIDEMDRVKSQIREYSINKLLE